MIVVGAGPAGALAAYLLARQSRSVLLVDRCAFPRPKVCGCCLNPAAQGTLIRAGLGQLTQACGAVPLGELRLAAPQSQLTLSFDGWLALSRERFDAALVAAAVRAGVTFMPETQARLGHRESSYQSCEMQHRGGKSSASAAVILAADGLSGRFMETTLNYRDTTRPGSRIGAGVVMDAPTTDYPAGTLHMAVGRGGYVGLVRLEDGRLNLAAAFDAGYLRSAGRPGAAAARLLQEVGWPIPPGCADQPWRGTPALTRNAYRPAAGRVLAVGDAVGYVEPFTGEGMAWALTAAEAVVPWVCAGWTPRTANGWSQWCRLTNRRRGRLIRPVAWTARRPRLTGMALRLMSHFPQLSGRVIARLFTPAPTARLPPPSPVQTQAPHTAPAHSAASTCPE